MGKYLPGKVSPDLFKSKNSQIELFKETIDVLKDLKIPTLIKPHYYTQMEIINEELNKIKNENIYITYTHPTVLALNAKIWICNLFSTTCGDAFGLGVPTVEYSDYNDKLKKLTNNSSQNSEQIDYFISKDKKKLQDTLVQILSEQKKISQRLFFKDKNNLIQHLMRD